MEEPLWKIARFADWAAQLGNRDGTMGQAKGQLRYAQTYPRNTHILHMIEQRQDNNNSVTMPK